MGQAAEVWKRFTKMLEDGELDGLVEMYATDALYYEPYSAPHRGNLLIQSYVKDYVGGKEDLDIGELRVLESADGRQLAVEWTLSYTAADRRWKDLPRCSFLELDDEGLIVYHRDYS